MTYTQLEDLTAIEAVEMVAGDVNVDSEVLAQIPTSPLVIIFGWKYWSSNKLIAEFVDEYVNPKDEGELADFFHYLGLTINRDPKLYKADSLKLMNIDYQLLYQQHRGLFRSPEMLDDWANNRSVYVWFDQILPEKRRVQFQKILKEQNDAALEEATKQIREVYSFSDLEITYLQYFCSQTKLDGFDTSLNIMLYVWSKLKGTGKSTVVAYITSFLNGEEKRNQTPHESKLTFEMQNGRFDIPKAVTSRCTMLDEGGYFDMAKSYNVFKSMITGNSCEVEYKFKVGRVPKKCHRNYAATSNVDPKYFVKDEDERRIGAIHMQPPKKKLTKNELDVLWRNFVLECNLSEDVLTTLYWDVLCKNPQAGEVKDVMTELRHILTKERIDVACGGKPYFVILNLMSFPEIRDQKTSRETIKQVITQMYGEADNQQRFFKINRKAQDYELERVPEPEVPF